MYSQGVQFSNVESLAHTIRIYTVWIPMVGYSSIVGDYYGLYSKVDTDFDWRWKVWNIATDFATYHVWIISVYSQYAHTYFYV